MLTAGGAPGGVEQLIAGTNITLSPTNGKGVVTVTASGGGGSSPLTTKGDLFGFSTTNARVPALTSPNGVPLQADSGQTLGVGYGTTTYDFNGQSATDLLSMNFNVVPSSPISGFRNIFVTFTYSGVLNGAYLPVHVDPLVTLTSSSFATYRAFVAGTLMTVNSGVLLGEFAAFHSFQSLAGTGTVTNAYGFYDEAVLGDATNALSITAYDGFKFWVTTNANTTIGTLYGFHYSPKSIAGGSITTEWAFAADRGNNYYAGKSAFGGTSTPAQSIDVQSGNLQMSGNGNVLLGTGSLLYNESSTSNVVGVELALPSSSAAVAQYGVHITGSATLNNSSINTVQPLSIDATYTLTSINTKSPIYLFQFTPTFSGTSGPSALYALAATPTWGSSRTLPIFSGLYIVPTVGSGATVTTQVGIEVGNSNAGTITTAVGLDIGVMTSLAGSTVWAMRVGNYNSYFNGATTFGGTGVPTWDIHVQGGNAATNAVGIDTSTTGPTVPGSNASGAISIYKGSGGTNYYLLITFNDAGTTRYKYLNLHSTGVTWATSTTLPT